MSTSTSPDRPATVEAPAAASSWRTVDIVVASAIAVAFGVVFWAWGQLWNSTQAAFTGFPPAQAFMYGVWLVPGVLGPLVIRKRGAAVFCALVAAIVSALLGTPWGLSVVLYGLVVVSPFLLLALLVWAGTRARRRRDEKRLLLSA